MCIYTLYGVAQAQHRTRRSCKRLRLLQLAKGGPRGHPAIRQGLRGRRAPGDAVHAPGGALAERAADLEPGGRTAGHGPNDADAKSGSAGARRAGHERTGSRSARAVYALDSGRAPNPRPGAAALAPGSSAGDDGDRPSCLGRLAQRLARADDRPARRVHWRLRGEPISWLDDNTYTRKG